MKSLLEERELEREAVEWAEAWFEAANAPGRQQELMRQLRQRAADDALGALAFLGLVAGALLREDEDGVALSYLTSMLVVDWAAGDELSACGRAIGIYVDGERPMEAG